MRSNLEIREGGKAILSITDLLRSYFDPIGFAAAKIAVLEFNWHTIPALAIEIVCCSMASRRIVLEL